MSEVVHERLSSITPLNKYQIFSGQWICDYLAALELTEAGSPNKEFLSMGKVKC